MSEFINGWIEDANGNRCSAEYFGSEDAAREALASLEDCRLCINCSDCSRCSGCSDCSRCSDCSGCSRCSDCSGCSRCSDCSGCSRCSRCSDCSDCSRCSDCSGCSRCSRCSGCSRCSRCSNVAFLLSKRNLQGDPDQQPWSGPPAIPSIPDIHKVVYEAASQPGACEMGNWHTCGTTHCRGGWVVHKAGEAGYALERFHGPLLAAQLIYAASGYDINPCRFFDNNEDAMEDMRRLAQGE